MAPRTNTAHARRGAAGTREAILAAARDLFSAHGYDQVGMRQIAASAGVDAALIVRYFGSKEGLLGEVLDGAFVPDPDLLAGSPAGLGRRLALVVLTKNPGGAAFDPVLILMRSVGNEQAAALLRDCFDRQFIVPLAAALAGDDAPRRAALVAAELAGIVLLRFVLGTTTLGDDDTDWLIDRVGGNLQRLIDGETG